MKNYELMLIFDSLIEELAVNEELSKITSIIEKDKGKVQSTDIWGVKKLAYPIKHQDNGFYVLLHFNSGVRALTELDRLNKINDRILRHFIVKSNENN